MGPAQVDDRMGTVPNLAPGEAVLVDWTESDYFADRSALTRSVLGLLPDHPDHLRSWMRGDGYAREPSESMEFGTAVHAAVLEPAVFMASVLPRPSKPSRARGNAAAGSPERVSFDTWKAACKAHEETVRLNPSAIAVNDTDIPRIIGAADALRRHEVAAALLCGPGLAEQTILWREPVTGILVKVRVDWLVSLGLADVFGTNLATGLYVNDLKTTEDDRPHPFVRSARKYNYLTQASMYLDAVEAAMRKPATWAWTVVTVDPSAIDGRHGVSVYMLSDEQRQRGRALYQAQALEFADRLSRDDWTPAHRRGFSTLPL